MELSHGDRSWIRSGFFLKWNDCYQASSATVTLIVFSASPELLDRFQSLWTNTDWQMTLVDPFSLYVIILDELWLQAESIARGVAEVFGVMERVRLSTFPWLSPSSKKLYRLANLLILECAGFRRG